MTLSAANIITNPGNIPVLKNAPTAKIAVLNTKLQAENVSPDLSETAHQEQTNLLNTIKKHNIPVKLVKTAKSENKEINLNNPSSSPEAGNIRQMIGRKLIFIGHKANQQQNFQGPENFSIVPVELTNPEFPNLDDCFLPIPNDAAVIYEGEYAIDTNGEWQVDENNWPVIIPGTETMSSDSRNLIRNIYSTEKLITISKAEATAHATNAVVLQSPSNGRYKLFVNGKRNSSIFIESSAIASQLLSLHYSTIKKIIAITNNTADVIEVPYSAMHSAGKSVSSTILELTSANDSFTNSKNKSSFFKKTIN